MNAPGEFGSAGGSIRRVDYNGITVAVADSKPTFWARVTGGRWEPELRREVARLSGSGTLFVDIGAWVGPIALLAAARGSRVLAFEPDPAARAELLGNIAANPALADRVEVRAVAVAARSGGARLAVARKPGDSMSSLVAPGSARGWDVETVTPAELAPDWAAAASVVVKIDIEGAEYDVLPVTAPVLARPTRAAFVAFHPDALRADPALRLRRTEAALEPFQGFDHRLLDGPPSDAAVSRADLAGRLACAPGTVLFERRSTGV